MLRAKQVAPLIKYGLLKKTLHNHKTYSLRQKRLLWQAGGMKNRPKPQPSCRDSNTANATANVTTNAPPSQPKLSNHHALMQFVAGLQSRLHRILGVIDDALDSENLKDRVWAVDQLLKRLKVETLLERFTLKPTATSLESRHREEEKQSTPSLQELGALSEEALISEIDRMFQVDLADGEQGNVADDNWEDITR